MKELEVKTQVRPTISISYGGDSAAVDAKAAAQAAKEAAQFAKEQGEKAKEIIESGGVIGVADYKSDVYMDADGNVLFKKEENFDIGVDENGQPIEIHDGFHASIPMSLSQGYKTYANGKNSHAEGAMTFARSSMAHAEGHGTYANAYGSHTEGSECITEQLADYSHAEGHSCITKKESSHAEGWKTIAEGKYSHAEGLYRQSNEEGGERSTIAKGDGSHAEGSGTIAIGKASHSEGVLTSASGDFSHAEGKETVASGKYSHAEGVGLKDHEMSTTSMPVTASGAASHAEGYATQALGLAAHSEGAFSVASGDMSHAEGNVNAANGAGSHAEGNLTSANGDVSHTEGFNTITSKSSYYSHAEGRYNLPVEENAAYMHGCGTSDNDRKNDLLVIDGKVWIMGVGGFDGTNHKTAKDVKSVINALVTPKYVELKKQTEGVISGKFASEKLTYEDAMSIKGVIIDFREITGQNLKYYLDFISRTDLYVSHDLDGNEVNSNVLFGVVGVGTRQNAYVAYYHIKNGEEIDRLVLEEDND